MPMYTSSARDADHPSAARLFSELSPQQSRLLRLYQITMADSSSSGAAAGTSGTGQPKAAPKPPNPVFKMMGMPLEPS